MIILHNFTFKIFKLCIIFFKHVTSPMITNLLIIICDFERSLITIFFCVNSSFDILFNEKTNASIYESWFSTHNFILNALPSISSAWLSILSTLFTISSNRLDISDTRVFNLVSPLLDLLSYAFDLLSRALYLVSRAFCLSFQALEKYLSTGNTKSSTGYT